MTQPYLNNNYFADPNPNALIVFGQLSRVTGFSVPNFDNEDMNLAKRFRFTESMNIEIRADAFNVINRHVFAEPGNLNPSPGNPAIQTSDLWVAPWTHPARFSSKHGSYSEALS